MSGAPQADWGEYQALFSHLEVTWLNHAGVSPISSRVAEAMRARIEDALHHGALHTAEWYSAFRRIKALAGVLLGCSERDLSITPNTTHGINLIANGLEWRDGDEIVLCNQEYPANVYPWWAQQRKGVKLVWVEPDTEGRFPVEAYAEKVTKRTRIVAVSHVQFASGCRHDLAAMGQLCREAGARLVVDAIQSFSVFPIRCEEWGVDALTTGSHKWLLGPTGIALLYVSPSLREEIHPDWVGADCMVDPFNYLDYRFEPLPDGRRFENAMPNHAGIAGLEAALNVATTFGRDKIEAEIRRRTDTLAEFLPGLGFRIHSSRLEGEWSGILSVTHPKSSPEDLAARLKMEGVVASVRDRRLRLAPHAYHTEEQFAGILRALERAAGA
ncbi:MAG: Cysteine desulfurase [bacterium]|nr:Cysteine desulfurase [bacterium]